MIRVLVVDDDQGLQFLTSRILAKDGCEVVGADDGLDALDLLSRDSHFDLVISDLRMPKMDGIRFLEQMAVRHPGMAVIISSVHSERGQSDEAMRKGAVCYLQKPFTRQQLVDSVHSALLVKATPYDQKPILSS